MSSELEEFASDHVLWPGRLGTVLRIKCLSGLLLAVLLPDVFIEMIENVSVSQL